MLTFYFTGLDVGKCLRRHEIGEEQFMYYASRGEISVYSYVSN